MALAECVDHRELKLGAGDVLVTVVLEPDDDVLSAPKRDVGARHCRS